MIKVRYCHPHELSPGLNARVACHGRGATIYLVPGLTADERRVALRRLRQTARMGSGPELPAAQLALALLADRIRTAAGRASAIFRLHPAGSALPVLLLSVGVILFMALSAVSIQVLPQQAAGPAGPSPVFGPGPAVTASANPAPRSRHGEHQVNLDRAGPPGGSAGRTRPRSGRPGSDSGQGSGGQGTAGGNGTTLTGSASSAPTPGAAGASTSPAPAGTPTPTPSLSPSPPAEPGGTCLHVGPIGLCLDL